MPSSVLSVSWILFLLLFWLSAFEQIRVSNAAILLITLPYLSDCCNHRWLPCSLLLFSNLPSTVVRNKISPTVWVSENVILSENTLFLLYTTIPPHLTFSHASAASPCFSFVTSLRILHVAYTTCISSFAWQFCICLLCTTVHVCATAAPCLRGWAVQLPIVGKTCSNGNWIICRKLERLSSTSS